MPSFRRSPYLFSLSLAVVGCAEPLPPVMPRDSGPRDSQVADAPGDDATADDAGLPDGDTADAAIIGPLSCTFDTAIDLMAVGRDSDRARPQILSAAASATAMVAVFVDDLDGEVALQAARATIADHAITRVRLPAPVGSGAPSIVASGDGWLLGYVTSTGEVLVQRLDADLAASGSARSIATGGASPHVARVGTGAYVAWIAGTRAMGRALAADGAPSGAAVELFALPAPGAEIEVAGFGTASRAIVIAGGSSASPDRVIGRVIEATGEAAPGTIELGSTDESAGPLALAGAAPATTGGYPRLDGAAVWDVDVGGFDAVRFLLLDATGDGPFGEFTVSESGEPAWGGAVVPLGTGYLTAYRERPSDGTFSRVRLAIMDRDDCALGRVDARTTLTVSSSMTGSGLEMAAEGGAVLIAWAETLSDVVEYRVASVRCGGGS